jgi:predicted P-loop ATPase
MKSDNLVKKLKEESDLEAIQLDFKSTKSGTIILPTFNNATILLQTNPELVGLFRFNDFAHQTELVKMPSWGRLGDYPKPLTDADVINLRKYLAIAHKADFSMANLSDAVTFVSGKYSYDPVKDYLNSIKWDGTPRIDNWLCTHMNAADNAYTRFVGKMTLVGACARIDKPGIKYDYMLILEGKQGIGKSEACKALGGEWFTEMSLSDRTKETVESMQGAWIIEVPELSVFKKKDIESLKAFITITKDKQRLPYGRRSQIFPRRNIFIGTVNPSNSGYLTDSTGNRRFLPVFCNGDINIGKILADKDQLWAEAWKAYKEKSPLYLTGEISAMSYSEQSSREIDDAWQQEIKNYCKDRIRVTSQEIWTECLHGHIDKLDRTSQMRISDCLQKDGWDRRTIRISGELKKGFSKDPSLENAENDTAEDDVPWKE